MKPAVRSQDLKHSQLPSGPDRGVNALEGVATPGARSMWYQAVFVAIASRAVPASGATAVEPPGPSIRSAGVKGRRCYQRRALADRLPVATLT